MSPILSTLLHPLSLLSFSLPSLILSESTSFYPGSAVFKLLASSAFVWRSLLPPPATSNSATWWVSASLVSGLVGDFCLIPSIKSYFAPAGGHEGDSMWFKVGMLAFMMNHAGYIVAFLQCNDLGIMDWKTFGAVFAVSVVLGDLCGMPVPWRDDTPAAGANIESRGRSGSPRLPVTSVDAKLKISDMQSYKPVRATRHARSDSGVTDLSISIPSTPKTGSKNNSPTTATPLLPAPSASSSSFMGDLIPKMHIPSDMKPLIIIYQLIITTMVASAAGTRGILSERTLGAFMFMVSDVMVGWDTFGVKKPQPEATAKDASVQKRNVGRDGWRSRGVGWVLYFGGQYLLAAYGAI